MLIPEILPDEFVLGYRARLRILNGFPDNEFLMRALQPNTRRSVSQQTGTPAITVLSNAMGTNCTDFVFRHSLIPFICAITQRGAGLEHGSPQVGQRLVRSGLRVIRETAHYCRSCVEEDLSFWGVPYWRRSHQIPGVDWCAKHGCSLIATGQDGFEKLPNDLIAPVADAGFSEEADHSILRRYGEIAQGLMDRKQPIHCNDASRVLGNAARTAGLRISPKGRRALPSDLAREQLPATWLAKHFPRIANKAELEYVSNFDGVCAPKSASFTTEAYVLMAALLYPCADEALFALTHPEHCPPTPITTSRSTLVQDNRRNRQLTQAYIDSDGIHGATARILNAESKNISRKLSEIGLPSLTGVNTESRAALLAILQGKPLEQVCQSGNLDAADLIDLLRTACLPLRSALEAMANQRPQTKPSVH